MIEIKKTKYGGPGIFLTRLEREFSKRGLLSGRNYEAVLSTDFIRTNKNFILRLDGINFLKMTPVEVTNFLRYRWKHEFRGLVKVNNSLYRVLREGYETLLSPLLTNYFFKRMNNSMFKAIKKADFIVYQSEFSRDSWAHFCDYYGQDKYTIIPNGVDLEQFSPEKRKEPNPRLDDSAELKLFASGSFRIHKRLQESIKLLNIILNYVPETKFYVLGNIDYQTSTLIKKLFNQNPNLSKNVIFLGHIDFDDLPSFYANMDIMLHPSWLDPCPNVVVESIASGTPVICPSTGGTPELVGDGGIIIDENFSFGFHEYYNYSRIPKIDYAKYLEAVLKIHKNRDFYSRKARNHAELNLDIKKTVDRYIELFDAFNR